MLNALASIAHAKTRQVTGRKGTSRRRGGRSRSRPADAAQRHHHAREQRNHHGGRPPDPRRELQVDQHPARPRAPDRRAGSRPRSRFASSSKVPAPLHELLHFGAPCAARSTCDLYNAPNEYRCVACGRRSRRGARDASLAGRVEHADEERACRAGDGGCDQEGAGRRRRNRPRRGQRRPAPCDPASGEAVGLVPDPLVGERPGRGARQRDWFLHGIPAEEVADFTTRRMATAKEHGAAAHRRTGSMRLGGDRRLGGEQHGGHMATRRIPNGPARAGEALAIERCGAERQRQKRRSPGRRPPGMMASTRRGRRHASRRPAKQVIMRGDHPARWQAPDRATVRHGGWSRCSRV